MTDKIKLVEEKFLKKDIPNLSVGDTVKVFVKIKEEDKTRLQSFEGTVIKKKGSGVKSSFTLRRISYGEGVERTFPVNSPAIERIEVTRKGKVRKAKLYYLRKKAGKRLKVEEKIGEEGSG